MYSTPKFSVQRSAFSVRLLGWGTLALAFTLSSAISTFAGEGTIVGTVKTTDGTALPHLALVVEGPGGPRRVMAGASGQYRIGGLDAGAYTLRADAPGLVTSGEPRADVSTGEARLDLVLAPAPVKERVVVSATRSEAPLSTLGISASALERGEIEDREATSLLTLATDLPGVSTARTGALGTQGGLFVRGGASNAVRVLVDGVAVNEPGGAWNAGPAMPFDLERIELVRGAASSLYGSDALAGVLHLVTRRADAGVPARARLAAEGGSFDWMRGELGVSGTSGGFDGSAAVQRVETDNEEPNSAFDQTAAAFSGGFAHESTLLRLAARGAWSDAGTPGQTLFGRPDLDASIEHAFWTVGANLQHTAGAVRHEVRAGVADTRQVSKNPLDSGTYVPQYGDVVGAFPISDFPSADGFLNDTRRLSAGYQAEGVVAGRHVLTGGVEVEHESGDIGSGTEMLSPTRTNYGVYAQDHMALGRVFLTAGARVEHNDSFGTAFVPRGAIAVRLRGGADATTLRASAGAGIKEPTFSESFGVSFFAHGNPDLEAERSRTYDLGVEQRFFEGRLRAQATWFHHQYLDQIAYHVVDFNTFQGTFVNVGESRARGLELEVDARPVEPLRLRARYTFLDTEVIVPTADFDPVFAEGQPLLRRPRHQIALGARASRARVDASADLLIVPGGTFARDGHTLPNRPDSDFLGLGLTGNDGYTRLDGRVHVRVVRGLSAYLAGENLLDSTYTEVLGYPAPGLSVRVGLRFETGAPRP